MSLPIIGDLAVNCSGIENFTRSPADVYGAIQFGREGQTHQGAGSE